MLRRIVTAVLLVQVLASVPCLAEAASHPSHHGAKPAVHAGARLREREFMRGLAAAAKAQAIAGELAASRASTPEVRAFGKQLARSRQRIGRRLALLSLENQVPLPARPGRPDDVLIARLRSLRGNDFDLAFLQQFGVEVQERELALYRSGLEAGADTGMREFAQEMGPPVAAQLATARKLLAQARGASAPGEQAQAADVAASQATALEAARGGEAWNADERDAMQGVSRAAEVLRTMKEDPRMDTLLAKAHGVLVFTRYRRGGLFVGARAGQGLLVTRHGDGLSPPAFLRIQGGSIGVQAGAASGATVYLLMTAAAVEQFRSPRAYSFDVFAAATLGWHTDQWQSSAGKVQEVQVWSGTRGAYAGAAIGVTRIVADAEANRAYYGRSVSASEILGGLVSNPHPEILGRLLGP